jgi:putative ABC transport system substrate-binding protein
MKRRTLIGLLGAAALAPLAARAEKVPVRIGWLAAGAAGSPNDVALGDALKQGLREVGLREGKDYILEARFAAGRYERFPELARELAQSGVRVILVNTIAGAHAAQSITPPIPIVMLSINDPVGSGLVESLARPGRHTTGMATLNEDLTPKIIELQREIVPQLKSIAVIFNPSNPSNPPFTDRLRTVARGFGIQVLPFGLKSPDNLEQVLADIARQSPDTLQIVADSGIIDLNDKIAAFALANRIPSFSTVSAYAEFGGLLSYGISSRELSIRSGYFVRRILDGIDPGELPVEQPTRLYLVINLKTARGLGVSLPPLLLSRADHVIE